MGIIVNTGRPAFLVRNTKDIKFQQYMFLRKGGKATHKLGDLSRSTLDAELICVSDEDASHWIGNFAEGFGFFGVMFDKTDCRMASEEEINQWMKDKGSVKF